MIYFILKVVLDTQVVSLSPIRVFDSKVILAPQEVFSTYVVFGNCFGVRRYRCNSVDEECV